MKFYRAKKMANLKLNIEGFGDPWYVQMNYKTYGELVNNLKAGKEETIIHYGHYRFLVVNQVAGFELNCKNITQ